MGARRIFSTCRWQILTVNQIESLHTTKPLVFVREWVRFFFYAGLAFLGLQCLCWMPLASLLNLLMSKRSGQRLGRLAIHTSMRWYLRWLEYIGACQFDLSQIDQLRGAWTANPSR